MKANKHGEKNAEQAVRDWLHLYLELRDYDAMAAMLHSHVTWVGTGLQEVCKSGADAKRLLEEERRLVPDSFAIEQLWLESDPLESGETLVFGGASLRLQGGGSALPVRLSVLCAPQDGAQRLRHIHLSTPSALQGGCEAQPTEEIRRRLEQSAQEVARTAQELRLMTEALRGGVLLCGNEEGLPVQYLSSGLTLLTGYTLEELQARHAGRHLEMVYEADRAQVCAELKRQLSEQDSFTLNYRVRCKNDTLLWVRCCGTRSAAPDGTQTLQCVLLDTSEQKAQQETLRLGEMRYEIALRASGIAMFEYDVQTKTLLLLEEAAQEYNQSAILVDGVETMIRTGAIEEKSVPAYREMYRNITQGAPFARCYVQIRNKQGALHDYELSLTNVFDGDGKPVRAIGVRRNVEEIFQLEKEKEFAKNLFMGKTLVFEADLTLDRIVEMNPQWQKLLPDKANSSFSGNIQAIVQYFVADEHCGAVLEKLSAQRIEELYAAGQNLMHFTYKCKLGGVPVWYEATVSIIRGQHISNLIIRLYHADISDRKLREQRATEERRLYETMVAKAMVAYEIDLTENRAMQGHEAWNKLFGIAPTAHYSDMIESFAAKAVHPDDAARFAKFFHREQLLRRHEAGERILACEYRKRDVTGDYSWVNAALHLYEDVETGTVKGFCYVEDIDAQKRAELELRYNAQHDRMTDLLNKATTEEQITEFLQTPECRVGQHAFLIIDIDYFKSVNDSFGHLYGDGVIKELAQKIRALFREDDIVGRVGGDEFCVFMKNISGETAVKMKAQQLCDTLSCTFEQAGKACTVSASVGAALCPQQGVRYEALYLRADKSLYRAKDAGKNRYQL